MGRSATGKNYFLIVRSVCFLTLPFHSKEITFHWYADRDRTVLHSVCLFSEDRHMGLTKTES